MPAPVDPSMPAPVDSSAPSEMPVMPLSDEGEKLVVSAVSDVLMVG